MDIFLAVGIVTDDKSYRYGYRSKGEPANANSSADSTLAGSSTVGSTLRETLQELWKPAGIVVGNNSSDLQVGSGRHTTKCAFLDGDPLMGQESTVGFFSQFLKVRTCYESIKEREVELGQEYSWIIRAR